MSRQDRGRRNVLYLACLDECIARSNGFGRKMIGNGEPGVMPADQSGHQPAKAAHHIAATPNRFVSYPQIEIGSRVTARALYRRKQAYRFR